MCQFIDEKLIQYKNEFVSNQKNVSQLSTYNYRNRVNISPLLSLLRVTSEGCAIQTCGINDKAEHTKGMYLGSSEICKTI